MARIPLTSGFQLCPEGRHVFRVYEVNYDENFGSMQVKMVNAKGVTHTERFQLKDANDEPNERALNAFSFFAKNVMNDFNASDLDPQDMVNRYVRATITHTALPSKKDPTKTTTFANGGEYEAADSFDETPCEKALNLGTPAKTTVVKSGDVDLASLLG